MSTDDEAVDRGKVKKWKRGGGSATWHKEKEGGKGGKEVKVFNAVAFRFMRQRGRGRGRCNLAAAA